MNWRDSWTIVKEAAADFSRDDVLSQAAALAFYTALGLAPTILLFLAVSAFLGDGTKEKMVTQVESLIGGQAAEGVQLVVKSAEQKPNAGILSAVVGIATLLFSASGIFAQLQGTLNRIWDVKPRPDAGWWNLVRTRLLSAGLLISVLFLLLVSLVVSTAIALVFPSSGTLWDLLTQAISLGVFILLFAMVYKFLPDVEIGWRDVWTGAILTAVLFAVGKYFIGLYLGQSSVASSYGAAGSLVALLVWVYYSAVIVFFGAEVTQVYATRFGAGIKPAEHAMRVGGEAAAAVPAAAR